METLNFEGCRVRYVKQGSGPPMVFLHNGGSSHHIWDRQLSHFSKRYCVYGLDLLGFGESDRPDRPYTLELYERLIETLVAAESLQRPILVGNCIGASAALEYAFHHPDAARALIVLNVCGGQPMMKRTHGVAMSAAAWRRPLYFALFALARGGPLHRRLIRNMFGSPPAHDDPLYRHLDKLLRHPQQPASRWNLMRGLPTFNKYAGTFVRPERLPPTYLLWGVENRVVSLACGRDVEQALRPDRMTLLEDAGHLAMHERADQVNALIESFLADFCRAEAGGA